MSNVDTQLETHSKIRAWWLRKFDGYAVQRVAWRPRLTIFGRVTYDCIYFLGPPQTDDPPSSTQDPF